MQPSELHSQAGKYLVQCASCQVYTAADCTVSSPQRPARRARHRQAATARLLVRGLHRAWGRADLARWTSCLASTPGGDLVDARGTPPGTHDVHAAPGSFYWHSCTRLSSRRHGRRRQKCDHAAVNSCGALRCLWVMQQRRSRRWHRVQSHQALACSTRPLGNRCLGG